MKYNSINLFVKITWDFCVGINGLPKGKYWRIDSSGNLGCVDLEMFHIYSRHHEVLRWFLLVIAHVMVWVVRKDEICRL